MCILSPEADINMQYASGPSSLFFFSAGVDSSKPCQCNGACSNFGDCCLDYEAVCLSCEGRCDDPYYQENECQCNDECPDHGNCCDDFDQHCDGGTNPGEGDDLSVKCSHESDCS
jgi:poly(U)-specific endoribonuclease